MRASLALCALALCLVAAAAKAQQDAPLFDAFDDPEFIGDESGATAVTDPDWLSDTVTRPHANIATSATRPSFTVMPLDAVRLDAVGLLPSALTGLPRDLWGQSEVETIARLFQEQPVRGLPAMLDFTETLALAEVLPPQPDLSDSDAAPQDGALFLARLDMLLSRGALDQAQALMERAGPTDPAVFRRFFDVSLLTDRADRACAAMDANPDIAPTFPARIFCLARSGDWSAAALSLGTGAAIGRITEAEADLIARFLDPELFEGEPPLPPDPALTPLSFTMRMAIAERPDLTGSPLAFVHADLNPLAGWRAQLDAAERLSRSGAIEPQQWFTLFSARAPSASGAVWDRVSAVQALDAALLAGDAREVAAILPGAWELMQEAGLGASFASVFAERLARMPLTGEAGVLARRTGLLSSGYEIVANRTVAQSDAERFAFDIARGRPATPPRDALMIETAIAGAFGEDRPAHRYTWFLQNARLGEALLRAALVLSTPEGDPVAIRDALLVLRQVGLEDLARRTALQILLLEP